MKSVAQELLQQFVKTLDVIWDAPADLMHAAESAIKGCQDWQVRAPDERNKLLLALVNSKLKLNKRHFQEFLDAAAARRVFPNYHDKIELMQFFDSVDSESFGRWLDAHRYDAGLRAAFRPITGEETIAALRQQLRTGAVYRSDARNCGVDVRKGEVLRSLFGSFVFNAFPPEALHRRFNTDCRSAYHSDYYEHLLAFHGTVLRRDCALIFLTVDDRLYKRHPYQLLLDELCSFVRDAYVRLANHCFFAVLIRPFTDDVESEQWKLFSDLVLYAEKHREVPLKAAYFRPKEIEDTTCAQIPAIDKAAARFDLANEGFFFRDCFVLARSRSQENRLRTTSEPVDLLVLFDKNERDETLIPCPACRSFEVAGNSYPSFGVRSWECQNPICPDRSAFDRGNRYSLSALIKQRAIKSDADQIPEGSLKKWKLDVVFDADERATVDMLVRHFSLHGDTVLLVNGPNVGRENLGRNVEYECFDPVVSTNCHKNFLASHFFERFAVDRTEPTEKRLKSYSGRISGVQVYEGDCFDVLSALPPSIIDGAVTSPPYYNARDYTIWPNIYCYLHDMYNSAKQVFRTLRPGSLYVFNVFDYFDNENNIALSAMGKKRMILGAYITALFRRVGFELKGNVVWYKGEIEGKRNFNQGNRSPYYQFPFNCWEHVLIFRKPGPNACEPQFPTILDSKPVVKMVRGENILGHSAPFPVAIPELLLSRMRSGATILDPYSGSMTTGRAAYRLGFHSISIELHREYCDLGLRLLERETAQGAFDSLADFRPLRVTEAATQPE
jgi:DNA modification methylase